MNIQHIASLIETLQSLGFEKELEYKLMRQICFKHNSFSIQHRMIRGKDVINFLLVFERWGKEDEYACIYYDAVFRKEINISDTIVNGINIKELDKLMQEIDWSADVEQPVEKSFNIETKNSWRQEEKIEQVVSLLMGLASDEKGITIADCLKFKYWCDTPVQGMLSNLNTLKSRFEISQRFYLFNNGSCISAEEAYRFLNNRWMEKSLQVRKKNEEDKEEGSSSITGRSSTDKNLLQKKRGQKAGKRKIQ